MKKNIYYFLSFVWIFVSIVNALLWKNGIIAALCISSFFLTVFWSGLSAKQEPIFDLSPYNKKRMSPLTIVILLIILFFSAMATYYFVYKNLKIINPRAGNILFVISGIAIYGFGLILQRKFPTLKKYSYKE